MGTRVLGLGLESLLIPAPLGLDTCRTQTRTCRTQMDSAILLAEDSIEAYPTSNVAFDAYANTVLNEFHRGHEFNVFISRNSSSFRKLISLSVAQAH